MSEKNPSFYDWEQSLKANHKKDRKDKKTALGILESEFKKFMEDWKKKNNPDINKK